MADFNVTKSTERRFFSFPITISEWIMLISDSGTLIGCGEYDANFAEFNTQGVWMKLSSVDKGEQIVSVVRLDATAEEGDAGDAEEKKFVGGGKN